MSHILVTNDFPPKLGGIQSYLWELWRRLPPERVTVVTSSYRGAAEFDAAQPFRVERLGSVLLPTPNVIKSVNKIAADCGASVAVIDPVLPLGLIGPKLNIPYAVLVHGAEIAIPAKMIGVAALARRIVTGSSHVIAGGQYPAQETIKLAGDRTPPISYITPGVDVNRFRPISETERVDARRHFDLPEHGAVVLGVSRLVPRKGFDVLIEAAALLSADHPEIVLAVAGTGRDYKRLKRLANRLDAPVRFLGQVDHRQLPALYGCSDVFAMVCRNRWGGLEQEGFGIVFLEAAACGIPQVGGESGGASEAIGEGETGVVVGESSNPAAVASALKSFIGGGEDSLTRRQRISELSRQRVLREFDYDLLAEKLNATLVGLEA